MAAPPSRPVGRVMFESPVTVAPTRTGELSLTIIDEPSRRFPLLVRLEAEGFTVVDERLDWSDVVDEKAREPRFSSRFVAPSSPGTYRVPCRVTYVVCGATQCQPRYVDGVFEVVVRSDTSP